MRRTTKRRQRGFIVSAELMLIATLLVIAMIPGLSAVRVAVVTELADVGDAIGSVSQSYAYSGIAGHHASSNGSLFTDDQDTCDAVDQTTGAQASTSSRCLQICGTGTGATAAADAAPESSANVVFNPFVNP